ncbi:hypothetical protein V1288_003667 [Bradyrhizobium sp. AZCC 2176]
MRPHRLTATVEHELAPVDRESLAASETARPTMSNSKLVACAFALRRILAAEQRGRSERPGTARK